MDIETITQSISQYPAPLISNEIIVGINLVTSAFWFSFILFPLINKDYEDFCDVPLAFVCYAANGV
jgi:hypothetical protein